MDSTDTEDEARLETPGLPVKREPVVKDALYRKIHARLMRYEAADAELFARIQAWAGAAQARAYGVRVIRPAACSLTAKGEAVAAAEAASGDGWLRGQVNGHASGA